jgi:hypothetical protein
MKQKYIDAFLRFHNIALERQGTATVPGRLLCGIYQVLQL